MERLLSYDESPVGQYHKARYEFAKQFCAGKSVVDVACGAGNGTRMISAVADEVLGIDPFIQDTADSDMLRHGFIETLAPSICDVIISFETIEHTISLELSIKMLASALKDDGLLITSFPNGWGETDYHLHDTGDSVLSLLEKYFIITGMYGQSRKSHVFPIEVSRSDLKRHENIIVIGIRKPGMAEIPLKERFALIYDECLRRQRQKTRSIEFKISVVPKRIRTKWKRMFGA